MTGLQSIETNYCCLLYGAKDTRFEQIPAPTLENHPTHVLVKVAYTGVCGTDVHFWLHGGITEMVRPDHPVTMGHEASGIIAALGTQVTGIQVGDRVAIEPGYPCRACTFCLAGKYNLCPDMTFAAVPGPGPVVHGTLGTYFRIPADFCIKLPKNIGLDEAVVFEPLAVAVHAVRLVDVKPGHHVTILGSGPVGLLCAAVAREFGATSVTVVDVNADRLNFAKSFTGCATYTFNRDLSVEENGDKIRTECGLATNSDIVIEATGVESCIQLGIELIKKGGSYIQVGMGKKFVNFPIGVLGEKEITARGCFRYGAGDFELAASLVGRGKIEVKKLITKVFPFEQAPNAWEWAAAGNGMKTLIQGP